MSKNPRINVTLDESIVDFLCIIAKEENKPVAGLVRDLVCEALERREDMHLSAIAEKRDTSQEKKYSHTDAWK